MIIDRRLDLGSLVLPGGDGVDMLIDDGVGEFIGRNFGAMKRRRTEPSKELSACRSNVLVEVKIGEPSFRLITCCSTSHSCLY